MKTWIVATSLAAALAATALTGCREHDKSPRADDKNAPAEGREETKLIRNTEHIGYAGNAIGAKVDKAITAGEEAKQRLDAAEAEQTAQ